MTLAARSTWLQGFQQDVGGLVDPGHGRRGAALGGVTDARESFAAFFGFLGGEVFGRSEMEDSSRSPKGVDSRAGGCSVGAWAGGCFLAVSRQAIDEATCLAQDVV